MGIGIVKDGSRKNDKGGLINLVKKKQGIKLVSGFDAFNGPFFSRMLRWRREQ